MRPWFRLLIAALLIVFVSACGTSTASVATPEPQAVATAVASAAAEPTSALDPTATTAPTPALDVPATTEATTDAVTTPATTDAETTTPSAAETSASAAETTTPSAPTSATDIILATTTSTQDSGLLDVLIPRFEEQTEYAVKTIAVGSGAAIALGERGEADVVLAHAPENEREFVASGAGIDRSLVMYNDFVLVGPADDPAALKGTTEIIPTRQKLATSGSTFVSRGDKSGTNQLELKLWESAQITPQGQPWYVESGTGMGQTLQIADQRGAYTFTDRATFLAWRDRIGLQIVAEGDPALLNIYHVIGVNPATYERVNAAGARAFMDFLLAPETQALIGEFGRDQYDQALFTPCANNSCGLANGGD